MDTEFEYFKWLHESIDPKKLVGDEYLPVLEKLFTTEFRWMKKYFDDENRAKDGEYLRKRFMESDRIYRDALRNEFEDMKSKGIDPNVFHWFYVKPCSCLEMMVALAIKIEYDFMSLPGEENIPKWFWGFVSNIGIGPYNPDINDMRYVEERINKWLNRRYLTNGEGGIFVVHSDGFDMPKLELRKQMYAVINENISF